LDVESVPKVSLSISDTSGEVSTVFPQNGTNPIKLVAKALVEDPFRGTNVQTVSLSVTNSSDFALIKDEPMNLASRREYPFQLGYSLPITIPPGSFNVTVSVLDAMGRTFVTAKEVTVTNFYKLILALVDLHRRPAANLDVSVLAAGELIDEMSTNSTGAAVSEVPSTLAVGPLTVQLRDSGVVILSRQISINSDSVLQLEVPLSDWNLQVRLQALDLGVSAAKVDLYLNGTLIASSMGDGDGVAHFASVPLGQYEIMVTSYLGSKRFLNVSHSPDSSETRLELPVLSEIPQTTVFILTAVAIVAGLGVFAASLRRKGARRFRHLADLLGGTIPQSAVVMILGPSGTGKSLLLQNILADSLQLRRRCVYVSNSELPSKVREQLKRFGVNAQAHEEQCTLRFIDAYSGLTDASSSEKHFVASPTDLTSLGMQLTSCLEELGGAPDVFFDAMTPIIASGASARGLEFVRFYGARTTKPGGTFTYVTTPAMDPHLLSRFEESSDCVLQLEKTDGPGKMRGRLLVKKARGLEHERDWVGFRITSRGRIEFASPTSD